MAKRRKHGDHSRSPQDRAAEALDQLALFEKFQREVLEKFQSMVLEGKTEKEIYAVCAPMAAARTATIALTDPDSNKALAAAKDVLDRHGGKATERKVVQHQYENLSDTELDALLLSQAAEADEEEEEEGAGPPH